MFIVAQHTITDPERFYPAAQSGMQDLPEGMRVHALIPSSDGTRATCLWEADSVDSVKKLVEDTVGDMSSNEFYEADAQNSIGLPTGQAAG